MLIYDLRIISINSSFCSSFKMLLTQVYVFSQNFFISHVFSWDPDYLAKGYGSADCLCCFTCLPCCLACFDLGCSACLTTTLLYWGSCFDRLYCKVACCMLKKPIDLISTIPMAVSVENNIVVFEVLTKSNTPKLFCILH